MTMATTNFGVPCVAGEAAGRCCAGARETKANHRETALAEKRLLESITGKRLLPGLAGEARLGGF